MIIVYIIIHYDGIYKIIFYEHGGIKIKVILYVT